jgi:hypothetical protein
MCVPEEDSCAECVPEEDSCAECVPEEDSCAQKAAPAAVLGKVVVEEDTLHQSQWFGDANPPPTPTPPLPRPPPAAREGAGV